MNDECNVSSLRPYLEDCGYRGNLLRPNFRYGEGQEVSLAAFAHEPADALSACIAVATGNGDSAKRAGSHRGLGAPVVFIWTAQALEWWKQGCDRAAHVETISHREIETFFTRRREELGPASIYRAKTWAHFEKRYQLDFVDVGLMPLVEDQIGQRVSKLIERVVSGMKSALLPKPMTPQLREWLLKSVFWLLAAKILRDKDVSAFTSVDLHSLRDVFDRVGKHVGAQNGIDLQYPQQRKALQGAAQTIGEFSSLAHVTSESLSYVYESTFVSRDTRSKLGTHSTPGYLVDYIVWHLAKWVEEIAPERRVVFEPACGHAAFLVSAMRLLRELLPGDIKENASKKGKYLRKMLRGIDIDAFALEIARLSLTLADIPNPDGWQLECADMFSGSTLEQRANSAMVLLANPPFERFSQEERARYKGQIPIQYGNKAAEMLGRTLPHLPDGGVFGVVVPQGFLHSKETRTLRQQLIRQCQLDEVCLFPDKVFAFSAMESAVIIGRKKRPQPTAKAVMRYRRIREQDVNRFKNRHAVTTERDVPQGRFSEENEWDMRIPDVEEVWQWCAGNAKLGGIFEVGQGLSYKGRERLPKNATTISTSRFPGAARGFARITRNLQIHGQPREVWLSLDGRLIEARRSGTKTGVAQIMLNYNPVSRGPWRLKAFMDREGHAVMSQFITVRPESYDGPLEFVWALCNSPFANAYVYAHSMKRHILVGTVRAMPLPRFSPKDTAAVAEMVRTYFATVKDAVDSSSPQRKEQAQRTLLQIDAEILRLYELPPRFERQMLDLFAGSKRPGVPFAFDRYFPEDFEPCFPLHEYLSDAYQRSTAGALRARYKPVESPVLLAALRRAVDDFEE